MHRALVTGAGQAIARQIALRLGAAGAEIVVNDLVPERAATVADEVRAAGEAQHRCRSTSPIRPWRAAVERVADVDILVNDAGNATINVADSLESELSNDADLTSRDQARLVLYGVMFCTRACLPAMIERRSGRIVTVITDTPHTGHARNAVYAGAKAGAAEFTLSTAAENARYGITANNVALTTMNPRPRNHRQSRAKRLRSD